MIVVDASALAAFLLGPGSQAHERLAAEFARGEVVCAPHLADVEVTQVLRNHVLRGAIPPETGRAMVEDLLALPIDYFPHTLLLMQAYRWRENASAYDGLYLALALVLGCPLVTLDRSLAKVPGCDATVEVLRA